MDATLLQQITAALHHGLNKAPGITSIIPRGGSSFASTATLVLGSGDFLFVKYSHAAPPGMFRCEYEALRLLYATDTLRVPEPLCSGEAFIVTRWIEFGGKASDWQETLGQRLALLHCAARNDRYGFEHDNYLGASAQPNQWHHSWLDFWRECRLGAQLATWRRHSAPDDELLRLGERLLQRLDIYLDAVHEPGVLLHGDLWSGNAAADRHGEPVIYDPASYYGHHEAEFGMMRLFGGFGPRVEAAYQEIWPFEDGSEERIALYRLYHELNHLNLFGTAYYEQCMQTMRALL